MKGGALEGGGGFGGGSGRSSGSGGRSGSLSARGGDFLLSNGGGLLDSGDSGLSSGSGHGGSGALGSSSLEVAKCLLSSGSLSLGAHVLNAELGDALSGGAEGGGVAGGGVAGSGSVLLKVGGNLAANDFRDVLLGGVVAGVLGVVGHAFGAHVVGGVVDVTIATIDRSIVDISASGSNDGNGSSSHVTKDILLPSDLETKVQVAGGVGATAGAVVLHKGEGVAHELKIGLEDIDPEVVVDAVEVAGGVDVNDIVALVDFSLFWRAVGRWEFHIVPGIGSCGGDLCDLGEVGSGKGVGRSGSVGVLVGEAGVGGVAVLAGWSVGGGRSAVLAGEAGVGGIAVQAGRAHVGGVAP